MKIELVPAFSDNYIFILSSERGDVVVAVDPGEVRPVTRWLEPRGMRLTHILATHHHSDHIDGHPALKGRYGCRILGSHQDRDRIPEIDHPLAEGEVYRLGDESLHVLDVPGHTRTHIAYWLPESKAVFTGDALFVLGCGRLFEGSPAQMWESLCKLRALPPDTRLYCGHEYTMGNLRFALTVDPDNKALQKRAVDIRALRAESQPTVPATIAQERETNPFFRADDSELQASLGMSGASPVETFAELRRRKDVFR
ncbi:Hydroxyacylglutathione hydrolase [Azospirillaceae bacterium]